MHKKLRWRKPNENKVKIQHLVVPTSNCQNFKPRNHACYVTLGRASEEQIAWVRGHRLLHVTTKNVPLGESGSPGVNVAMNAERGLQNAYENASEEKSEVQVALGGTLR